MSKAARVTKTVPDATRDSAEARLLSRADGDADERYIRGYQQKPETPEELLLSESLAAVAFGEEVWE